MKLWIEVSSGLELDAAGATLLLDGPTWKRRDDRLSELEELPPD